MATAEISKPKDRTSKAAATPTAFDLTQYGITVEDVRRNLSPAALYTEGIQGDGFNPLWQEVQVIFTPASGCKQFFSDTAILDARDAHQVTLRTTTELYRCSVVGKP